MESPTPYCLDARTGQRYWVYDTKASIWGSPFYVDGKVFVGTDAGNLFVFKHGEQPPTLSNPDEVPDFSGWQLFRRITRRIRHNYWKSVEEAVLIRKIELDAPIRSTLTVANGVLYVNTSNTLYAIGKQESG